MPTTITGSVTKNTYITALDASITGWTYNFYLDTVITPGLTAIFKIMNPDNIITSSDTIILFRDDGLALTNACFNVNPRPKTLNVHIDNYSFIMTAIDDNASGYDSVGSADTATFCNYLLSSNSNNYLSITFSPL